MPRDQSGRLGVLGELGGSVIFEVGGYQNLWRTQREPQMSGGAGGNHIGPKVSPLPLPTPTPSPLLFPSGVVAQAKVRCRREYVSSCRVGTAHHDVPTIRWAVAHPTASRKLKRGAAWARFLRVKSDAQPRASEASTLAHATHHISVCGLLRMNIMRDGHNSRCARICLSVTSYAPMGLLRFRHLSPRLAPWAIICRPSGAMSIA
jgi:hypothetical protein